MTSYDVCRHFGLLLLTSFPVAAVITDYKVANGSMDLGKYLGFSCQVYNNNFSIV